MSGSPGAGGEGKRTFLIRFFGLSVFIVLADQLAKYLALKYLDPGSSVPLIPGIFHLTLVHNPGIAFGLFGGHEEVLFLLITASLVVLLVLGLRMHEAPPAAGIAFALILGGAAGNWIDRLRFKAVVDFLDFRVWPVFNLADSAITVGVGLYLLLLFLHGDRSGQARTGEEKGERP